MWPGKGLPFGRKIRSLPPLSPYKGLRSSTTPPKQSSQPNVLNPTSSRVQPSISSDGNGVSYYTHLVGTGSDNGSHEVVRLSPSFGTLAVPRGMSPSGGHQLITGQLSPRTCEETSIEIIKSDSKEDSGLSPSPR
eukprot:CAMPEP_0178843176 /NCGR_PEP_ID=MMETSP0746-20121128/15981_1 /TAXON_ID=913974 /ORGANISM="Nitzschia punctata, Strain CCMP561" /LENGTH=134 /DNA_ID=CAMNT_0020506721 /DNA_START=1 /DNA_END=406 /DNA_ORIENTATION=-